MIKPKPPIVVDRVLDDPTRIRQLTETHAPYEPIQRYFASLQEQQALGGPPDRSASASAAGNGGKSPFVVPLFRGDWAYDRPVVPGVEPILYNERFIAAARQLYGGAIVRPQIVYINLSLPMPLYDAGHTDIPARWIDRTRHPVWLLALMGRSGLFEPWRIRIATAVSWWYGGEGGEFTCWPNGPDSAPETRSPTPNTAMVGDNDFMFHRVERTGPEDTKLLQGLTLDSRLCCLGEDWSVSDRGRELARVPYQAIRISVSWKAQVLEDEREARVVDEHLDDLTLDGVWRILLTDLRARGVSVERPTDPLRDPGWIAALTRVYDWGTPSGTSAP